MNYIAPYAKLVSFTVLSTIATSNEDDRLPDDDEHIDELALETTEVTTAEATTGSWE